MRNQTAFFIILDYKLNKHLLLNIQNNKSLLLNSKSLSYYLDTKLFFIFKKRALVIFVLDLVHFDAWLRNNLDKNNMKYFRFKNRIYSITYKNALYINNRLLFKDIANFIKTVTKENLLMDIKLLSLFANKVLNEFQVDILKYKTLSLTGLANRVFKQICAEEYVLIKKLNEKEYNFIRKAFYGGRNEIIKPLLDDTYAYDVNSLYPFIMSEHTMPIGKPVYVKKVSKNLIKDFYGFVDVLVKSPSNIHIPVLPIKSMNNFAELGILYPKGYWRGVYFSEELKLAIDSGYQIIDTFSGYSFNKQLIFKKLIKKVYNLRFNEDDIKLKKLYKMMMNSLYGKYASVYENIKNINKNDINSIEVITKRYDNIAIAAAIASLSRSHMYKIIINNNLDLHYWDTDGIIIKNKLTNNIGDDLGQFRLVDHLVKGVVIAPKMYVYRNNQDYRFILRGISQTKYILDGDYLYKQFLIKMNDLPNTRFEFILDLHLINKNTNDFCKIDNQVHNKRKYVNMYKTITSLPWEISSTPTPTP